MLVAILGVALVAGLGLAGRGPTAQALDVPAQAIDVPAQTTQDEASDSADPGAGELPAPPDVGAAGAVLYDPADDRVVWGRDEDIPRLMASTTKIMTVLVALEAGTIDDTVVVSPGAAATGGASLDLVAGQEIPMSSLLAGLMLRSGNDAAVAVAEHLDGSEEAFVERMNGRAAELGLDSTTFVNASGLTDDLAHAASPLDLARLGALAMEDPMFAEWASAPTLTVPGLAPMESRNELLTTRPYPGATGIKTGFTTLAGLCLVASAERDGRQLVAVVLGADDSFGDVGAIFDHGFDDHHRPVVAPRDTPVATYRWGTGAVDVVPVAPLVATVPVRGPVAWQVRLAPVVVRPVEASAPMGAAELTVAGTAVASVELVAATGLEPEEVRADGLGAGDALAGALRAMGRLHVPERPVEQMVR